MITDPPETGAVQAAIEIYFLGSPSEAFAQLRFCLSIEGRAIY